MLHRFNYNNIQISDIKRFFEPKDQKGVKIAEHTVKENLIY
ncbi:hypothetical protein CLERM_821 [Coxiella-like endosymbiont]|nr:hypothetical protein CLERM_821 [Coxiella-like endosymbiont]